VDALLQARAIPSLRIMKYHHSRRQYDTCVAERACPPRARSESLDSQLPAAMLSYQDARAYAAWLSAKTGETAAADDEEWRRRGKRARDDAWGSQIRRPLGPLARQIRRRERRGKDDERLRPIGAFGVNERGLADLRAMSGNGRRVASCLRGRFAPRAP